MFWKNNQKKTKPNPRTCNNHRFFSKKTPKTEPQNSEQKQTPKTEPQNSEIHQKTFKMVGLRPPGGPQGWPPRIFNIKNRDYYYQWSYKHAEQVYENTDQVYKDIEQVTVYKNIVQV